MTAALKKKKVYTNVYIYILKMFLKMFLSFFLFKINRFLVFPNDLIY